MTDDNSTVSDDGKGRTKAGRYDLYFKPERKSEYSGKAIAASYAATFFCKHDNATIGQSGFRTRADAEQWALTRKGQ